MEKHKSLSQTGSQKAAHSEASIKSDLPCSSSLLQKWRGCSWSHWPSYREDIAFRAYPFARRLQIRGTLAF